VAQRLEHNGPGLLSDLKEFINNKIGNSTS